MTYTEIQVKNGKKYYYRTLSIREDGKSRKFRRYLGKELTKKELREKERLADSFIKINSGRTKRVKIGQRKLYKQSGAGFALTIGLPMNWISKPIEVEKGLIAVFPGDLTYNTTDFQFLHYFSAEESKPIIDEIFVRLEKDSK